MSKEPTLRIINYAIFYSTVITAGVILLKEVLLK